MTSGHEKGEKLSRPSNMKQGVITREAGRNATTEIPDLNTLVEELRALFGDDPGTAKEILSWIQATVRTRKPPSGDSITVNGSVGENVLIGSGTFIDRSQKTIIQSDSGEKFLDDLEQSYFRYLVSRVNDNLLSQLVIRSVTPQAMPEIELERLYVPLDCTGSVRTLDNSDQALQQEPVLNVINRRHESNFVILGDPGSGKTTFINYLTLALANALLRPGDSENYYRKLEVQPKGSLKAYKWDRSKAWKPLRIELSDLADSIADDVKEGEARLVTEYIRRHFKSIGKEQLAARFERYLARGECFVMFDGLDEVYSAVRSDRPANGKSRVIRRSIESFVRANKGNRFLVTCRVLSYLNSDVKLDEHLFSELRLAPLNEEAIEYFINNWYAAISNEKKSITNSEAFARVRSLKRSCTRDLFDIARNPMLLTVMAIIHTYSRALPNHKVQLYKECIDLLLFQWNQSKIADSAEGELRICDVLDVPYNQLMSGLCKVAYYVQSAESRRSAEIQIPRSALVRIFTPYMGGTDEEARSRAEDVSTYIEKRAGLLVGKGKDSKGELRYAFAHRGFQEYLAALDILNERTVSRKILDLCAVGGFWYEVVMLAIGELVHSSPINTSEVMDIIYAVLPLQSDSDSEGKWRRVWWAAEMLQMVGLPLARNDSFHSGVIKPALEMLTQLITTDRLSPIERARAADVLGMLGDPRPGVLNPEISLSDMVLFDTRTSGVGPKLDPFYVARYPVTNAQFRAFTRDTIRGVSPYYVREFWTDAGRAWVSRAKGFGGFIHDPSWGIDNRPVSGVTWYEAQAYVRWLSYKTKENYRLLTEAEWEHVASGGKGRPYPWGTRKITNQTMANTRESSIGETCVVGIFTGDRTDEGVFDLGGNVFEWTSSSGNSQPQRASDGRDNLDGEGERVLRGGCYALGHEQGARVDKRQVLKPDSQMPQNGFRIARDARKR